VEFGCNVNEQDMDGWTPLYTAARYNHYDVARELLYFRADPEIRAVRLALARSHLPARVSLETPPGATG